MTITADEKKHYPLARKDSAILEKIHEVEKVRDLSDDEQFLLIFLRSQLEKDWREPCLQLLKVWIKNKKLSPAERWAQLKEVRRQWWTPETS